MNKKQDVANKYKLILISFISFKYNEMTYVKIGIPKMPKLIIKLVKILRAPRGDA
jgi:hypothetical protein